MNLKNRITDQWGDPTCDPSNPVGTLVFTSNGYEAQSAIIEANDDVLRILENVREEVFAEFEELNAVGKKPPMILVGLEVFTSRVCVSRVRTAMVHALRHLLQYGNPEARIFEDGGQGFTVKAARNGRVKRGSAPLQKEEY
jgi:hypothetical protein